MQFISSSVVVRAIVISEADSKIVYFFEIDGVGREFFGELRGEGGIKGVEYSEELEDFLMGLMPVDPGVSKKLVALSWACADGEGVEFPVTLI